MRSWMIGIVLGILPVTLLARLPELPLHLLLSLAAGFCLLWRQWPARFAGGLAVGFLLGVAQGEALLQRRLPDGCTRQPLIIQGRVASLPRHSRMADGTLRQRFEFELDDLRPAHCRGPGRLLLSYYGSRLMSPGQRWRFGVKLRRPWGLANPGSFNMQAWFALSGIDALGSVISGSARAAPGELPWNSLHHRLRADISQRIARLPFAEDVLAILRAITVADKGGMDQRLWQLLQHFGVNHLLVISGLHVGLVAGAGYLLGALCQRLLVLCGISAPWLCGVLGLLMATTYAALAGFSLATQRALCMLACFIIARLAGRISTSANNLLLAAVVVLCLNPLAALGSGFWLSFGAVATLLWLACWQSGRSAGVRMVHTHVGMALMMLPVGAWWFGGGSVLSACANLVMIPLVGFWVVPMALLAVLAYWWDAPWEMPLWRLAAWPLQQLVPAANQFYGAGHAWAYRHFSAQPLEMLLATLAVLLLVTPCSRAVKAMAAVLFLPLLLPWAPEQDNTDPATRVTVLDVGQGTAVVIQAGSRALLYDTGGGDPAGATMATTVVLPYLRARGVSALDTFVISHPDRDHSAGAAAVLQALPVQRLRFGGRPPGVEGGKLCIAGQAWRWPGGQHFQFLSPAQEPGLSRNDRSCVLQVRLGNYRLLLPGDIENARERDLVRYWREGLRSDWLLLAHHGSATSSSPALLKTVQPRTVIINSGYANRFGHPHPDVMRRVRSRGLESYATADGGALEFEFHPDRQPIVKVYRRQKRRFWM